MTALEAFNHFISSHSMAVILKPTHTEVQIERDRLLAICGRLESDLLDPRVAVLNDFADMLEREVEASETWQAERDAKTRERWKVRCHIAAKARARADMKAAADAKIKAGALSIARRPSLAEQLENHYFLTGQRLPPDCILSEAEKRKVKDAAERCRGLASMRENLKGDDLAPPEETARLLHEIEAVKKMLPFRWRFYERGAKDVNAREQPYGANFGYRILCGCDGPIFSRFLDHPGPPMPTKVVELVGHFIRLGSGHLRVIMLGKCSECPRVHWFELAMPDRKGEEDTSVKVYRDHRMSGVYVNGAFFSDAQLMSMRCGR